MPRKPRFDLPGVPVHIVQRGNNRQTVFFDDDDRRAYLTWLTEAADRQGCAIHAYVLMTNHVHLLATAEHAGAIAGMMQHVGRRYVPYVNLARGRTGTLWEGRYRAHLIDAERYLMICHRYIGLNPVRAGMAAAPGDYAWSSYRANAEDATDPVVQAHPVYAALGRTAAARRLAYRALFVNAPEPASLDGLRRALQTGTPLGDERFRAQVEAALERTIGHTQRGRPRKPREMETAPGQWELEEKGI